jgi:TRAP-type C4-dicarboxylate transport system permease small subunit
MMRRIAEGVAALLFAAMFGVFVYGVAMRYVLRAPVSWSDEVTVVLMLWSLFWTAGLVLREREHVAVDLVYAGLPPGGRRLLGLAAGLGFGVLFLAALPTTADYILFLWRERTSALGWRLDIVYACFVLFMAAVAARLLFQAWRLAGARWREHV